jgi:hypothetical protein
LVALVHKQSKPTWLPWSPLLLTVKNLVAMVAMIHKQVKPTVQHGSPKNLNFNNFKMIEAMGFKIIATRST